MKLPKTPVSNIASSKEAETTEKREKTKETETNIDEHENFGSLYHNFPFPPFDQIGLTQRIEEGILDEFGGTTSDDENQLATDEVVQDEGHQEPRFSPPDNLIAPTGMAANSTISESVN